jgi:putative alpha-1,2-mannosidase
MNSCEVLCAEQIRPETGVRCDGNTYARTYPGPSWPFGIAQPGPDNITGWDYTNGYSYDLDFIEGFSMMRMSGVGWYGDFGNLQVMPTTGPLQTFRGLATDSKLNEGWRSRFFHRDEEMSAGYYSVLLHRYNIRAELTDATLRDDAVHVSASGPEPYPDRPGASHRWHILGTGCADRG